MSTQLSHALARIQVLENWHEASVEYIKDARLSSYNLALEKAAKVCDELRNKDYSSEDERWVAGTDDCAAAIRAMKKE